MYAWRDPDATNDDQSDRQHRGEGKKRRCGGGEEEEEEGGGSGVIYSSREGLQRGTRAVTPKESQRV